MTPAERNAAAMECLSKQDFAGAQKLFFDNARTALSHETYNNLGYFLCTEGLECRSGKTRYAGKLGFSYLLKAEKLKCTSVNQSNIAGELEKRRAEKFCKTGIDDPDIRLSALHHAELAVRNDVRCSDECEYNRLRFLFLCDRNSPEVFDGMKNLAAGYETDDSIEFLLNLYCIHSETDKCLKLMREYGDRLDGYAKLSLYCRCRDFSSAAALCDEVYESFAPDDAIIAMMAESLINSGEIARAEKLKAALEADVPDYRNARKFRSAVEMTFSSPEYRENVIKNYRYRPPYLTLCGYFGCEMHGTGFYSDRD